ncbi:protein ABIL2-like [Andrographis paniculata]|uniref:protein ABIL2-like n=1 Tax=Andrographis paniculata TaxID=175694 RepID=UPI0021E775EE|nr:protein ABIL2-like [Andrographis paniculata]
MSAVCSTTSPREPSNPGEVYMQQHMLFTGSLKDLKNLRKQLYEAAEYFELSFNNDFEELDVLDSLKDYSTKALVSTTDHFGSMATKVSKLLDDQARKVSKSELKLSCVEQKIRTIHKLIDCEGRSQQSLAVDTPKYHSRYLLPVGDTMRGAFRTRSKYQGCNLDDIEDWHEYKNAIQAKGQEILPQVTVGKGRSSSPTLRAARQQKRVYFSSNLPNQDKGAESTYMYPHRTSSLKSNPVTPNISPPETPSRPRPMTPNRALRRQQYLSEVQKAESLFVRSDKDTRRDSELQPGKSKGLFKGFLSRHKAKKDDHLDIYLDNTN